MIWDPIRSLWVKATPEESIRQKLILKMIRELGYPKGLMSVEKDLPTQRRFDLLCYAKTQEGIRPLLLVECKADKIDEATARQAQGYNASIGAPFLCLAGGSEIQTLWWEQGKFASVPFLPKFADLLSKVCF